LPLGSRQLVVTAALGVTARMPFLVVPPATAPPAGAGHGVRFGFDLMIVI
jgi:hypothetical protein